MGGGGIEPPAFMGGGGIERPGEPAGSAGELGEVEIALAFLGGVDE